MMSEPKPFVVKPPKRKRGRKPFLAGVFPILKSNEQPIVIDLHGFVGVLPSEENAEILDVGFYGNDVAEVDLLEYIAVQNRAMLDESVDPVDLFFLIDVLRRNPSRNEADPQDDGPAEEDLPSAATGSSVAAGVREEGSSASRSDEWVEEVAEDSVDLSDCRRVASGSVEGAEEVAEDSADLSERRRVASRSVEGAEEVAEDSADLSGRVASGSVEGAEEVAEDSAELSGHRRVASGSVEGAEEVAEDSVELSERQRVASGSVEGAEEVAEDSVDLSERQRVASGSVEGAEEAAEDSAELSGHRRVASGSVEGAEAVAEDSADLSGHRRVLMPEELLFLSYGLGVVRVRLESGSIISPSQLFSHLARLYRLEGTQMRFAERYAVYHELRRRGWVLRPGLLFGVDYLLYRHGPPHYHASLAVSIATSRSPPRWRHLAAICRVTEHTGKQLLLVRPQVPPELDLSSVDCLKHIAVEEVMIQRWAPSLT